MSSNIGWDWHPLEKARWNIVDYGYSLGHKVASPDIILTNSPPVQDWIKVRKAAIAAARDREPDPTKRNAILAESLFLLELAETLIIIASSYANQIKQIRTLAKMVEDARSVHEEVNEDSIHTQMAYGL
jgi:hypothetical protein